MSEWNTNNVIVPQNVHKRLIGSYVQKIKRHHRWGHSFKCAGWLKSEIKNAWILKIITTAASSDEFESSNGVLFFISPYIRRKVQKHNGRSRGRYRMKFWTLRSNSTNPKTFHRLRRMEILWTSYQWRIYGERYIHLLTLIPFLFFSL